MLSFVFIGNPWRGMLLHRALIIYFPASFRHGWSAVSDSTWPSRRNLALHPPQEQNLLYFIILATITSFASNVFALNRLSITSRVSITGIRAWGSANRSVACHEAHRHTRLTCVITSLPGWGPYPNSRGRRWQPNRWQTRIYVLCWGSPAS